jgi:hypothetical protein
MRQNKSVNSCKIFSISGCFPIQSPIKQETGCEFVPYIAFYFRPNVLKQIDNVTVSDALQKGQLANIFIFDVLASTLLR